MPDPELKRFGLRDIGILASLVLAVGGIIHNAASSAAANRSTADWHEARITKLEGRLDKVEDTLHVMDKKLDLLVANVNARP